MCTLPAKIWTGFLLARSLIKVCKETAGCGCFSGFRDEAVSRYLILEVVVNRRNQAVASAPDSAS